MEPRASCISESGTLAVQELALPGYLEPADHVPRAKRPRHGLRRSASSGQVLFASERPGSTPSVTVSKCIYCTFYLDLPICLSVGSCEHKKHVILPHSIYVGRS